MEQLNNETVEELVVRAQLGDTQAYDRIVHRFQDMAFSYAFSILGDYELAEDARQEAFIGAYCDLMALREPAAFPGWFRRIVHKHSVNFRRKRRVLTVPLDHAPDLVSLTPGPKKHLEKKETQETVNRAIDRLPEAERLATRLYYIEGLSLREISAKIEIPAQTVKSRLHTARARLRQRLMGMLKHSVQKQQLAGDKRVTQTATLEALSLFETEIRSILGVQTPKDIERAGDLLCAKGRMYRFLGKMQEAHEAFQSAMAIPALKRNPLNRARFKTEIGLTHIQTSHYEEARKELMASRRAAKNSRDPERRVETRNLLAATLNGLGMCAWGEGDFKKARKLYQETVEVSRLVKCEELEVEALNNLGLLDWKAGHLPKALETFRLCLKRWKKIHNRFARSLTLMNIGVIEENLGRTGAAARHYQEALDIAREVNFIQVQAATYSNLGNLALTREDWNQALECSNQAIELFQRIKDRRGQSIALENLALAHMGLNQPFNSRRALHGARKIAKAIGDRERLFSLDLVEIESNLKEGKLKGIRIKIQRAKENLAKRVYTSEIPRLLRLQGHAEILSGEEKKGHITLRSALRECEKQKNRSEEKKIHSLEKSIGKTAQNGNK